jgi:hypothetical protein
VTRAVYQPTFAENDMTQPKPNGEHQGDSEMPHSQTEQRKEDDARKALDEGDKKKIDETLDDLNVSKTESGKDQSSKPDTEGSNSSSKNLDEEND